MNNSVGKKPIGKTTKSHRGFTLIELMVTISIIAILAGLVLVALGPIRANMRNTQVQAEMRAMESSLAAFQQEFGRFPPSGITLFEEATDWSTDARSKAIVKELWPNFDFTIDREMTGDVSTDATYQTDTVTLDGSECLVFFLGGVVKTDSSTGNLYAIGFAKNPVDPFDTDSNDRKPVYFQFDSGRLKASSADGVVYLDKYPEQSAPLWYLSGYGGQGYRQTDLPNSMKVASGGNGVYRTGTSPAPYWNAERYQLISPGRDAEYGIGGTYLADGDNDFTGTSGDGTSIEDPSNEDKDNITNFSSGLLD